ncbi:hypothetical protein T10_9350, partial [Trichinella papuae]
LFMLWCIYCSCSGTLVYFLLVLVCTICAFFCFSTVGWFNRRLYHQAMLFTVLLF